MDTKLKNNRKLRIGIVVISLTVLSLVSVCSFPAINQQARMILTQWEEEQRQELAGEQEINTELLAELYAGCYVLYLESMQRQGTQTAADVYLDVISDERGCQDEAFVWTNSRLNQLADDFEKYRSVIDYCVPVGQSQYEKNTSQSLESVLTGRGALKGIDDYYSSYFVLKFDENGILSIDDVYCAELDGDDLIKALGRIARIDFVWGSIIDDWENLYAMECRMNKPSDFTVIFGVPKTAPVQISMFKSYIDGENYWVRMDACANAGGIALYIAMLVLIAGLVCGMTSKRVWGKEILMKRSRHWTLMEAALIGVCAVFFLKDVFIEMIWYSDFAASYQRWWEILTGASTVDVLIMVQELISLSIGLFMIYGIWYLSLRFLRPVFSLGLREYVRQYSFIYQIFPWIKRKWEALKDEWRHIDFSESGMKTVRKAVIINFIVLVFITCFWYVGIWFLIAYSVVLFYFMKNYYYKIKKDYELLLQGVHRIAEGNLESEIMEDIGIFEPFKGELAEIQTGFKKAVDEEVKSQRMKTDLITNVSHDLKTPLTAITTYVELLKKPDITEEERKSYIEVLEKKSLRLKVLIEDLFEVSKATSNNIVLQLVDVDVVNLMKQVGAEYSDKFAEMGLELRWKVSDEKIILSLDSQKTYRVFENLFVNIHKYGMPNSRVYLDVEKADGWVRIIIKNMSAQELYFDADEITERFVRGDASRNTEGSGLGLAIAKSFVEAQGGKFHIEVDGDLFKAVIWWKCNEK